MSVLIKGMKMPAKGEYELTLFCHSDGTACATVATTEIEGEPFDVIEVPPHGRLIDFDAFNDEATKLIDKFYENGEYAEERGANMLRHIAIEQPTIIEAEEGENNEIL